MKYRKKPVVIEAFQLINKNRDKLVAWCKQYDAPFRITGADQMEIQTLEGTMTASWGDWIIKGVKDEFYPCKPDIFEATYEAVE